jgi:hypothetical protein
LGNGGNAGSGGLHPLAAAAAGLPGQVNTNSGATTTTTVLTGSTATIPALGPVGFLPVANRNDNPPCNTLFIGNLSDQVTEPALKEQEQINQGQPLVACSLGSMIRPGLCMHALLHGSGVRG